MDTDNSTLWYPKPSQIDLREYVTNPPSLQRINKSSVPMPITYTLHFTAINGVQPQVPQNIVETRITSAGAPEQEVAAPVKIQGGDEVIPTTSKPVVEDQPT